MIIWKCAFRNALIGPLTRAGLLIAGFTTGAVITETVWPGLGRVRVQAANNNDFPVVAAAVLFTAFVYVAANILVDVLYAYIDPRIRYD